MTENQITAAEFAKSHATDPDWVAAMGSQTITPWKQGDAVKYSGYEAAIIRHYHNGMFEIRLPGGVACVGHHELKAA
jgi:hypothetical protein